jgi:uncharacterized RDD family membrane protein YckC
MNPEDGVFYPVEAYAGFWLRLMIELIDTFVVSGLCIGLSLVLVGILQTAESLLNALLIGWILIWFCYFVLLKHSKLSTIGYRIGNVKIVTLQGNNPSIYSLSLRLIFSVIGPFNILLDLSWITSDPHRQSLRDKVAHTYVIKRDAHVAGRGKIIFRTYSVLGWNLVLQEVDVSAKENPGDPNF